MKNKKERVDVEVLFPGDKKPTKVETGVQVTLEYDEVFADFNLTEESARKLDEIRAKHLGRYLGEDVKKLRAKLGMSQKDMSLWLGLGAKTISRWENGHSIPSLSMSENLRRIELIEDAVTHNILPKEYIEDPESYLEKMKSEASLDEEPVGGASYNSWDAGVLANSGGGHGKSNVVPFDPLPELAVMSG